MLKLSGGPCKKGFNGSFCRWSERRCLFCGDLEPIHHHLGRSLRREDFPPVVKDDSRLAVTRPGILTLVERRQTIFWLYAHLEEAHVILLFEIIQGEHRSQDRPRFDTDENCSMNSTGDHGPIFGNNKLVESMFVYLADECWIGNG